MDGRRRAAPPASRTATGATSASGDGFYAFRDPTDPDLVYVEYQGGEMSRVRLSTGESREIQPLPGEGEPEYRFNWNTPIHLSPNEPGTVYIGAQFLFRSRDKGESWEKISPDLTTNDPKRQQQLKSGGLTIDNSSAENHTTIYSIAESPKNGQVIWVGTDDGNLQVTRDGGKTWTNVAKNLPGVPPNTWVSHVEAGHSRRGHGLRHAGRPRHGRHEDLGLQDHRLRADLEAARDAAARRLRPRDPRGPGEPGPALPGHGARPLHLGGRRGALGALQRRRLPARWRCATWRSTRARGT